MTNAPYQNKIDDFATSMILSQRAYTTKMRLFDSYFEFYISISLIGIDIYFREISERIISRNQWP